MFFFFELTPGQIHRLRTHLRLKQAEFAQRLGVNQSTISKWETGANRPEGEEQQRLLRLWSEVFGDGQGVTPSSESLPAPSSDSDLPLGDIPEIDVTAGAGLGGEAVLENFSPNNRDTISVDSAAATWRLPPRYLSSELRVKRPSVRIITIEGDSMSPTLQSGDRVMVDIERRVPSPPGIFALWDGLGVIVKRVEYIPKSDPATVRITSDNPAHSAYERTVEEAHIIGRVIWFGRRL